MDRTMIAGTTYVTKRHAAVRTKHFVFNQLIPYIGNKRKLLDLRARKEITCTLRTAITPGQAVFHSTCVQFISLRALIGQALAHTERTPEGVFFDAFAGTGVVSRMAKTLGYRVIANDWEPYAKAINNCYIAASAPPAFARLGGYDNAIAALNALPPRIDWITDHLCPRDDAQHDVRVDRMFYMRKNGMRIDAIRPQIAEWRQVGLIDELEQDCLLAPLLYQTCYTSNTSGVFKGFHNGWGGQTRTALYRIAGDLRLAPAVFHDNGMRNEVLCEDAQRAAERLRGTEVTVAYLDPPYNQHPYGSNYHVLNSVSLWDKPVTSKSITPRTKSAIRLDWRTERRSAYNYADEAASAYRKLLDTLGARYVLTSYSTDGTIRLGDLLAANAVRGRVRLEMKGYKRYRVSSQRFSEKPMNVEFIVVLDTHKAADVSAQELREAIESKEQVVLNRHPETAIDQQSQLSLF